MNNDEARNNTLTKAMDQFLCRALRGEEVAWGGLLPEAARGLLLQRVVHHGVQALLYHRLHQHPAWHSWPAEIRQALEASTKAGVAKDLARAHLREKILSSLKNRNIRCLLTKGEALALTHYATPGTRDRCDIDLFIHMHDIEAALQAALDAGGHIDSPIYKSHQFTVKLPASQNVSVNFDIHWRWLNQARFARVVSFEEAFAASVEVPGLGLRTLDPVRALLLACLHRLGSEAHDPNRLIWIYDIHLLVSALNPQQLEEFAALAVTRNVQAACLDGLLKANQDFGSCIPDSVREALEQPEARPSLRRRIDESHLGLLLDDWKRMGNRASRLGLLRELFLPSGDALLHRYGKASRWWLPVLYVRQVLGGTLRRLMLR